MGFIDTRAYAGLENNTGYTFLCQTELSEKLDEIFGFDKYRHYALMSRGVKEAYDILIVESQPVRGLTGEIQIPVSREVDNNTRSALTFLIGSSESMKIAEYFSNLAKKVGFFFALPLDDVIKNSSNKIIRDDVEKAVEEGYIRTGVAGWNSHGVEVMELTDKFCPVEKHQNW